MTTATDIVDGSVPVTCVPASGSSFARGTTLGELARVPESQTELVVHVRIALAEFRHDEVRFSDSSDNRAVCNWSRSSCAAKPRRCVSATAREPPLTVYKMTTPPITRMVGSRDQPKMVDKMMEGA